MGGVKLHKNIQHDKDLLKEVGACALIRVYMVYTKYSTQNME